jgi:hypothetical protein
MSSPARTQILLCCLHPVALAAGCGRTPLLPPSCDIEVVPALVDFGEVRAGETAAQSVQLRNRGAGFCEITGLALVADAEAGFALAPGTPSTFGVGEFDFAAVTVTFRSETVSVPLKRSGQLVFSSGTAEPGKPILDRREAFVPLASRIHSECSLAIRPAAVDFGRVRLGTWASDAIELHNQGTGTCEIRDVRLAPDSDPQFDPFEPDLGTLRFEPGEMVVLGVGFQARDAKKPHRRTGAVRFATTYPKNEDVTVPLAATVDVGCELVWTPAQVDFGLVILNNVATADVTLRNEGTENCIVSRIDLAPDSDPDFSLDPAQARALSVAPDGRATVRVVFRAADSAPPYTKTGTLVMQTSDLATPEAVIPLSAYVSTVCIEASRWVYTVDDRGRFARFDPPRRAFTDISTLACPTTATPNSMAVDQNAVAWVGYTDGNLFEVDTATGKCQATTFVRDQAGIRVFGMGFVFDPATGRDTLFIAGGMDNAFNSRTTLATVSFPGLVVTPIGPVEAGNAELTGTGDGELWGFVPAIGATGAVRQSVLVRIDPASGKTLESHTYTLASTGGGFSYWAVKFWGGSFWIFFNGSIYEVARSTPDKLTPVMTDTGRNVVGAGVSTCAPLQ